MKATVVFGSTVLASGVLLATVLPAAPAAAAATSTSVGPPGGTAPGAPGALSHFDLARKDCVGTAVERSSKVWYTVAGGVLSDVYNPTVDNTNVQTMQFLVTDGHTFTDLQTRDTTYSVRTLDDSGLSCEVTSTARTGRYRIVARYVTDPRRDAVVVQVHLSGPPGLALYVRLDPSVNGNVAQTARVDLRGGNATLALGFGRDAASAVATAGAATRVPFQATLDRFADGWHAYDATLHHPPAGLERAYRLSANVVKASEDKTFPGAIVASVASPWGQAVSAGATPNGKPVYFGSYREVFSRDLYEAYTGLLVDGDLATARDTVRFLFLRQQLADGRFPRNSLLNGKTAPDTGGDQLDESSYPILMAWQAGLAGDDTLWPHVKAAADFVVSHGPSFGSERWEEQSGYSPSTIAAEIAGLVAAGATADRHGDHASAIVYRATADQFQRSIKGWTVTTSGPYAARYFIRLSKTGDPNAAISYGLGNGGTTADQTSTMDGGRP